jgi:hypothetical protein
MPKADVPTRPSDPVLEPTKNHNHSPRGVPRSEHLGGENEHCSCIKVLFQESPTEGSKKKNQKLFTEMFFG